MRLAGRLALVALLAAAPVSAQLKALETKRLRVVTDGESLSYLAPHVARCFDGSIER